MPLPFSKTLVRKRKREGRAAMNHPSISRDLALDKVLFRRAKLQDVEGVHEVLEHAFRGLEGRGYSTQAIEAAIVTAEEIKKRIDVGGYVTVAGIGDRIICTVTGLEEHKSMHVCSLAVHPEYQKCGVAHQLMLHLEKTAHQQNCQKLFLCTAWAMKEAIRLYESLGYIREGYLRNHFYGEDFILFSKFIKRGWKGQCGGFLNH